MEFSSPCPPSGCLTPFVSTMLTSHRLDVSGLAASTTYTFRVRVKDASGNTSTSAPQSFKTAALPAVTPTSAPTAPTNLEAHCNGGAQVSLRWSPVSTAATYDLRINDLSKAIPTPYDYVVDGLRATTSRRTSLPESSTRGGCTQPNALGLSGATRNIYVPYTLMAGPSLEAAPYRACASRAAPPLLCKERARFYRIAVKPFASVCVNGCPDCCTRINDPDADCPSVPLNRMN